MTLSYVLGPFIYLFYYLITTYSNLLLKVPIGNVKLVKKLFIKY